MKLLHIISSVNPEGGGPIEGVNQLSQAHIDLDVEVEICSLDNPDDEWVINHNLKVHALGPGIGGYSYSQRIVPWLKLHAHKYDALIVNGLWQYSSFAVWLAIASKPIPYYVFPHGMLGPWFKYTYPLKHLKKCLYWPWAEYRVLRDARRVCFTCEEERKLARESFRLYQAKEEVSGFGITTPPTNYNKLLSVFYAKHPHLNDKRIVLFLGRIHKVKGCDILIKAFSKISHSHKNLHLVMAGPDQTGWVPKLKKQAEIAGIAHKVTWTGSLQGEVKWGAFYAAEVFCLPSHHENFGVVVAEALACETPVLISNKVNIWREILTEGAGLVADDTLEGTIQNMEHWLNMSQHELEAMKARTNVCFKNHFHVRKAANRLLEILNDETSKNS